jgi:hypothetical protein
MLFKKIIIDLIRETDKMEINNRKKAGIRNISHIWLKEEIILILPKINHRFWANFHESFE